MTAPLHGSLRQCTRRSGDTVRYKIATKEFAVATAAGILRTYFKPVPCFLLPAGSTADCHRFPDNLHTS